MMVVVIAFLGGIYAKIKPNDSPLCIKSLHACYLTRWLWQYLVLST